MLVIIPAISDTSIKIMLGYVRGKINLPEKKKKREIHFAKKKN